jgi:FtsH-binding integral membrane protein
MAPLAAVAVAPAPVDLEGGVAGAEVVKPVGADAATGDAGAASLSGVATVVGTRVVDVVYVGPSPMERVEAAVRHGFVRKMLLLLTVHLAVTFGWIVVCSSSPKVSGFLLDNSWVHSAGVALLVTSQLMVFCVSLKSFGGYVVLVFLTIGESIVLGRQLMWIDTEMLLQAMGLTVGMCAGLTLFALQTRWDITGWGWYMYAYMWQLMLFGLVAAIFRSQGMSVYVFYASLGVLLFSFYLVHDVQMTLKDEELQVDDYVKCAAVFYLRLLVRCAIFCYYLVYFIYLIVLCLTK